MHLNGEKTLKCDSKDKVAGNGQMDRIFVVMKKVCPQGVVCPCPRAIYMYMTMIFKHNLSSLKPLGQSRPNFMWSIVRKGQ